MTGNTASTATSHKHLNHTHLLTPALYGCFNLSGSGVSAAANAQNMQDALKNASTFSSLTNNPDECLLGSTSEVYEANNVIATIIGTPWWSTTESQKIAQQQSNAAALLEIYNRKGNDCASELQGSFAYIIIDNNQKTLSAGVDRLASIPLYYTQSENHIVFGTSAGSVLAHESVKTKLRDQGLYNYVYFHMVPSPTPIYEDMSKLLAGYSLFWKDASVILNHYWIPTFKNTQTAGFEDKCIELRATLKDSVKRCMPENKSVAAFLSGGLDSSSVTGMLSELSDSQAHAYSIGFSAKGYDEMAYARITAKHFGVKLHEYYVTPEDIVDALPTIVASYDEPFGNSSALPAYFCAKEAAKDGVQLLLGGDGGDELFAGNERYAKQKVFELYGTLPKTLRSSILEPLLRLIPGQIPLADKARSYVNQANISLPARMQTYNFLNQHAPKEIFCDSFIDQVSTNYPLELLESVYQKPQNATSLSRMLYLDWQFTLADNDLRKVSHMCALAGIEVAYPMLDDTMLALACDIPDDWKLKGQKLRYFYKEAMKNWLPNETITKKKQGFGLPFGVWMQTHKPLQDLAYESLLKLKKRRYFKPEFLDNIIKLHREGHAAYYGELIWILMVFELWLESHNAE
ncbi:asparagine synthetase B family protein [Neptunomonas antarctica]|uniref:asparagine synthase (glutamine-hydrolyzing) n=1 Tax=Neptunomonas antarctica TaxID=619304 RepID=A0A1N7JEV2_9GAMM|nr:asparagine synthase-related protein [Neptunomonas antarctica]SIS47830.1 asparagine synthase (glutamine-hydrolysing) [Neptunomonas antarctica]